MTWLWRCRTVLGFGDGLALSGLFLYGQVPKASKSISLYWLSLVPPRAKESYCFSDNLTRKRRTTEPPPTSSGRRSDPLWNKTLVNDDPGQLHVASTILSRDGMEIIACSGADRLESSDPQEGLGLGLYIVKELVTAHGAGSKLRALSAKAARSRFFCL